MPLPTDRLESHLTELSVVLDAMSLEFSKEEPGEDDFTKYVLLEQQFLWAKKHISLIDLFASADDQFDHILHLRDTLNDIARNIRALIGSSIRPSQAMDGPRESWLLYFIRVLDEILEKLPSTIVFDSPPIREFVDWMEDDRARETDLAPPIQGSGPHFGLQSGRIDFELPPPLDLQGNNVARIKALAPILRSIVDKAVGQFGRNQSHGRILDALSDYQRALAGDVETLNYDVIAAYGIILANTESAAARSMADRLEPELEDAEQAALKSILDIHGPFILSTRAGQSLLDDLASYQRTPFEISELRSASIIVAQAIAAEQLATPQAAHLLVQAAENIGEGQQPLRSAGLGASILRNAAVPLIAGAAVVGLASVAVMTSSPGLWLATFLTAEGVKKSQLGIDTANVIRDAVDDPSQRKNFKKLAKFALRYETQMRVLAESRREYKWIGDWLDWLQANSD